MFCILSETAEDLAQLDAGHSTFAWLLGSAIEEHKACLPA